MGLSARTAKHLLLLLNFILAIAAVSLIGFGIYILVSNSDNVVDFGENFAGGLVIAIGVILLILTVFGSLAAIHESQKRLIIYGISVIVLLLIQLILMGGTTQGSQDGMTGAAVEGFKSLWEIEMDKGDGLTYYEKWLHCCGVNGTDDYTNVHRAIPKACCVEKNCIRSPEIYTDGCLHNFLEYLSTKLITFSVINGILVLLEAGAIMLTWFLIRGLKNLRNHFNYR